MPETVFDLSFSPVAGIQWVETIDRPDFIKGNIVFQSRCRDSVG